MSGYRLVSLADAAADLARVFSGEGLARIEVLEDKCFADSEYWWLGEVYARGSVDDPERMFSSVSKGAYEWKVRPLNEAKADLERLLAIPAKFEKSGKDDKEQRQAIEKENQRQKKLERLDRALDSVATVAVRLGFSHPTFDPSSVEEMPFRRGTTIVADTSGVIQGGLDFVVRHLSPTARIKIPAVVHMEIVNQADNFLKRRRASTINQTALLLDHLVSQAGQRVLLRLEFRQETEVERTLLVGDPLRNAFQRDGEQEWAELNLSVPLRSYCDRLVVEAARQHQSHANPGHAIRLLTSDQGFARMAISEGIPPLYFQSIKAGSFFGRHFAGTFFHPLTAQLIRIPLQAVLWELATAFGTTRLISSDRTRWVEVAAIGEELSWSPIHSRNDLLWVRSNSSGVSALAIASEKVTSAGSPTLVSSAGLSERKAERRRERGAIRPLRSNSFYRFNPDRMFQLVHALAREGQINEAVAMRTVQTESEATFAEYSRFLVAGEFVNAEGARLIATDHGLALAAALNVCDPDGVASELSRVSSLKAFFAELLSAGPGSTVAPVVPERVDPTYRALGEIVCAAAPIGKEGFFATPTKPKLQDFVRLAFEAFDNLDTGDGFVSVGLWLEALIRSRGIHPERTRRYLDEASASGLLVRSTEGSTTDTRHDDHAIRVLKVRPSGPRVEVVHLYRGDFLVPNKSSSSIRLGGPRA